MTDDNLKYLFNLPPEEIVNWYKSKGYRFSWDWADTWQDAHSRAFTVAKAMKLDILKEIKAETDRIFTEGISYEEFAKNLEWPLKRLGWWGKVKASEVPGYDPASGVDPEKLVQLGSPRRLKTIYNVNANVAYNAGRYKFFLQNAESRPLWKYNQIDRESKRKSHEKFADKVFRYDDPIWDIIYPPSDWNCGCYVTAHDSDEIKQERLKVSKGKDFIKTAKEEIPEEWQYNPGKSYPAWDNTTETAYKASQEQKSFTDFNRLKAKDIPPEDRVKAPNKFPSIKEVGRDKIIELLKKEFGLTERDNNLIDTFDKDKALFTLDNSLHILEKEDGRERYIPFIKATLQNPFEIYLTEYEDQNDTKFKELRKTYIGLFLDDEENEDIFISLQMKSDSTLFWNMFRREKGKIDKLRIGWLLYGK